MVEYASQVTANAKNNQDEIIQKEQDKKESDHFDGLDEEAMI